MQISLSPFSLVKLFTRPLLQSQSELILCPVRMVLFQTSDIFFDIEKDQPCLNHLQIDNLWELFKLIRQNNSIDIMKKAFGIWNQCDAKHECYEARYMKINNEDYDNSRSWNSDSSSNHQDQHIARMFLLPGAVHYRGERSAAYLKSWNKDYVCKIFYSPGTKVPV